MKFTLFLMILTLSTFAKAATFKIFAAEVPSLLVKNGEGVAGLSGVYGKIVAEKIISSGKVADFEVVWVPWKRALFETQKTSNALFFPLAWTPEREKEFTWLVHLGTVEAWFYSTDSKVKISSWDELKKYRIGFMNGSMREAELKKILGDKAPNLDGLTEDIENYKKLIFGRIDLWVTQTQVFEQTEREYKAKNLKSKKVYPIKKFVDQEIWLTAASNMAPKYQDIIREIFGVKKKAPPAKTSSAETLAVLK